MKNTVDFPGAVKMWIEDERVRFELSHPDLLPKGARVSGPHLDSKVGKSLLVVMAMQRLEPLRSEGIIGSLAVYEDATRVALLGDWSGTMNLQRDDHQVTVRTEELYEDEVTTAAYAAASAIDALGWNDYPISTTPQMRPYLVLASHPDITMDRQGHFTSNESQHRKITYSDEHGAYLAEISDFTELAMLAKTLRDSWDGSVTQPKLIAALTIADPTHLMLRAILNSPLDITVVGYEQIQTKQGSYRVRWHRNGHLTELTGIEVEGKEGQAPTDAETKFVLNALKAADQAIGTPRAYALALNDAQLYQRKLADVLSQLRDKSPEEAARTLIEEGLISMDVLQGQGPTLSYSLTGDEVSGSLKRSL